MARRLFVSVLAVIGLLAGTAILGGAERTAAQGPGNAPTAAQGQRPDEPPGLARYGHAAVCPGPAAPGTARCHSRVVLDANGNPAATAAPAGYGPTDLRGAYDISSSPAFPAGCNAQSPSAACWSAQPMVAIVDAYDDPRAESDLGVYRSHFGLPSCTTANGCFKKINQSGGTTYPRGNGGWAQEISLDLDMVSAICPTCRILLVEANSNAWTDLTAAVDRAASTPGVVAISNSYGGTEGSGETTLDSHYQHQGIAVTASSGDNGYGVSYPAASQYVTAVGGTTLTRLSAVDPSTGRLWRETAWSGAGSGCSTVIAKPLWQSDPSCPTGRTVADVSAIADPNTGVAVYDSYGGFFYGRGWMVFGGTSVASPIVASVYALAGNAGTVSNCTGSSGPGSGACWTYTNAPAGTLYDVVAGSNGSCGGSYLCTAGSGYDGPTGLGTPNGSSGF